MIKRTFLFSWISALLLCIGPVYAQNISIPSAPSYHDASLDTFVTDLRHIIATRDTGRLMSLIDPHIKTSFGINDTDWRRGFHTTWQPGSLRSAIWGTLTRLLDYGPAIDSGGTVWFPYLFLIDLSDADAANVYQVPGTDVRIRQRPDASAPIVGTVSHALVSYRADRTIIPICTNPMHSHHYSKTFNRDWVPVMTTDHKVKGFIYWQYVYHPFEYRMAVERKAGHWYITTLVNGD